MHAKKIGEGQQHMTQFDWQITTKWWELNYFQFSYYTFPYLVSAFPLTLQPAAVKTEHVSLNLEYKERTLFQMML